MTRAAGVRSGLLANLSDLRFLAEASAMNLDPKVSSAAAGSRLLRAPRSTEDQCLDLYEDANREVRRLIDREKRRPAIKETIAQRNYWIVTEGENMRVRDLSEKYGVTEQTIRDARRAGGRNVETGRPRVRADKQKKAA